jgi:hypothetical protein
VNGDGLADLIVGDPGMGRVHTYLGNGSGLLSTSVTLAGPTGSTFGNSVATARDVNGDGYDDVIIGAHSVRAAYVYLGGAAALDVSSPIQLFPQALAYSYGFSVAGLGDADGDGRADVAVGDQAALGPDTFQFTGEVYIYPGTSGGSQPSAQVTLSGPDGAWGSFGACLASRT